MSEAAKHLTDENWKGSTAELREMDRRLTRIETSFQSHEEQCLRLAEDIREAQARIEETLDRRFTNLSNQLVQIARGDAGTFREVISKSST